MEKNAYSMLDAIYSAYCLCFKSVMWTTQPCKGFFECNNLWGQALFEQGPFECQHQDHLEDEARRQN